MGNRLSKIYTRTGDDGSTGLGDGSRIGKDSLRVEAYGTVDELNSVLGVLLATSGSEPFGALLSDIQHNLFDLGGELCIPGHTAITSAQVDWLEQQLDDLNADLEPLKDFILPGGSPAAAHCHVARTVCRRAERLVVSLTRSDEINMAGLRYLNRLSDLLFVLARKLNQHLGVADRLWQHRRNG
ncbi:MAG: cob(I)yrinic acid a,c-diamide adenosyltransferase [Gammaproteobacteria bacterium]|nr:MAG: cob(I)yrinic acid a,c-diamide adenosyltransferase [Gammaproteobacteria bacterium]RLA15044.1 MAG: cob(I)yrinic acid a,c-diamide adenosyltransferase [Gammaproteobacteria bacterium]